MKTRVRESCRSGFTLIEVTLALLLVAVGIVTLLGLFPTGVRMSRESMEYTRVAQFAETVLNAIETEFRADPRKWDNIWGGQALKAGNLVTNCLAVPGGNAEYNWDWHVFSNAAPRFGVWHNEHLLAPMVTTGSVTITNIYKLALNTNLVDFAMRYRLTFRSGDKKLVELLAPPAGKHLYNPDPASTWPSANPATPGIPGPPLDVGLPPYANDFFSVWHGPNPPQQYRNMRRIIGVNLTVTPGQFGPLYRRMRSYGRYYYDYDNRST